MKPTTIFASLCALIAVPLLQVACSSSAHIASTNSTGGSGTDSVAQGGSGATGGSDTGASNTLVDAGSDAALIHDDLLIDDFEDGDGKSLIAGSWYGYEE